MNKARPAKTHFKKNNQHGFTLFELIVYIGISAIISFSIASYQMQTFKKKQQDEAKFWLAARRLELQNYIKDDTLWANVVALNPNLKCFTDGVGCAVYTTEQPLKINFNGALLDGTTTSLGIDNQGNFCNSYSAASPLDNCKTGVELRWISICDSGACKTPRPKIIVRFSNDRFDSKSYRLEVYRDARLESLNEVCGSFGGTLVGTVCTLPQLNASCSPTTGSFALGFDAQGILICGNPDPGACAVSDVVSGFDAAGRVTCAPACN